MEEELLELLMAFDPDCNDSFRDIVARSMLLLNPFYYSLSPLCCSGCIEQCTKLLFLLTVLEVTNLPNAK